MASRGADGTLKLWDLRAFKTPLAAWDGLDTNYANTSCCFSPDERLLLTGDAPHSTATAAVTASLCMRLTVHHAAWCALVCTDSSECSSPGGWGWSFKIY
jgi:WD40 repeat protein